MIDSAQFTQWAVSALGACIVAIGWWIGQNLVSLNEKVSQVLAILGEHKIRLEVLEEEHSKRR